MDQRRHHREHSVLGAGIVGVGDLRHHRGTVPISGNVGQSRRTLGGWAGSAKVGPGSGKAVAGGGYHDDVGLEPAQVFVFQPEVLDDPRGKVLGEHIADAHQLPQQFQAAWMVQVQGNAQLIAVLLVEVGPPIPELPLNVVLKQRVGSVALQPLAGLQPDDLRPHVCQHLHG